MKKMRWMRLPFNANQDVLRGTSSTISASSTLSTQYKWRSAKKIVLSLSMPEYHHYSNYPTLPTALIGFGQVARENGLNVGVQETLESLSASEKGIINNTSTFRYALKSIYCCSEEDSLIFEELYDWFWGDIKNSIKGKTTFKNQTNLRKKTPGSLVMLGKGKEEAKEVKETKSVSGANEIDRLRKTDFSKLSDIDSELLERLANQLFQQMSLRLKRRAKSNQKKGRIDLRKTIRESISNGGDPILLKRKQKKKSQQKLVLLLDVSGSMDKYSFFLLRFILALGMHFKNIEAFIFSTKLIRITDYLQSRNLDLTLHFLSASADNWSGGTTIGTCLQKFNEQYAKRILNGSSTVLILSDGLDTGDPSILAQAMRKIKSRTKSLIWLNPLKGMTGYQPIQQGMEAALPNIDVFKSAHNLNSILELEQFLMEA